MYTDLHCHLLFGIDDGAQTAADALAMARALVSLGFSHVAPSPHALPQYPGEEVAAARREELQRLLKEEGIPLTLYAGAENWFDVEFVERELAGQGRHINGTAYVLVELPYEAPVPALPEMLFRLRRRGVRPVIAHPERCMEFERKGRAEEAVRTGATLQLDLGSLIGRYGRGARKVAERLLGEGLYGIAATDLHGPVGAERWISESMEALRKSAGDPALERLLSTNPARILRGEELEE